MKNSLNFENFKNRYTLTTSIWDWYLNCQNGRWILKLFPSIDIKIEPEIATKSHTNHISTTATDINSVTKHEDIEHKHEDFEHKQEDFEQEIKPDILTEPEVTEQPEVTEPVSHKCNDCDDYFSSISDLSSHKSNVHGKQDKKFQCTGNTNQ